MSLSEIAACIDHTLLKPNSRRDEIEQVCRDAAAYRFAAVCINPYWVPLAADLLAGSSVAVCTVIAFPFGVTSTAAKAAESETALGQGATELDMVLNVGALLSGDLTAVRDDIGMVVLIAHQHNALVKVILETALLSDAQIVEACEISISAGADFVKTSTGFATPPLAGAPTGATVAHVALMRRVVDAGTAPSVGVKASGGIRTLETFHQMISAGATRIGTSAGPHIVDAARS